MSSTLPLDDLFEQINRQGNLVILCATHRLARNLRLSFGQRQIGQGTAIWPTPRATTVDAWLASMGEQISLLGEIPADMIPDRVLSAFQGCLVWQQSIEAVGGEDPALPLFDLHNLAKTAAEAHALINTWQLRIADDADAAETQQFLGWQAHFNKTCQKHGWVDVTEYQKRVLGWLARGAGALPSRVVFAGFDSFSPHLGQLQTVLANRGVEVLQLELSTTPANTVQVIECEDAAAECRAAAAWARHLLDVQPAARIGIVVADLEARRATLVPILDAALHPAALLAVDDAAPRQYNVSLGLPLTRQGLVRTALALLRLLGRPRGMPLTEFGDLLRMPYWSADQTEADLRAQVDAKLRERPGQDIGVNTVLHVAQALGNGGAGKLLHHLSLLGDAQFAFAKDRLPSAWAVVFRETLVKVGWPGTRTLSSTEFQTRAAFFEALDALAQLDAFLGSVNISAATSELARLCREKIFQPKTLGQPAVQVLGLLEATGAAFDALWVMGMNDQHWPPPARPNPLLSAALQRRQRTPGASAEVQSAFAGGIHQRLLHSAPDVTFSYAEKENERELRGSPLLATLLERKTRPVATLTDQALGGAAFEYLDDHQAPALSPGEQVAGGTGLLKAQAICPAWAFYRYRLGAKQLKTPAEGLDASRRGTLVHAMLEAFWKVVKDSAGLAKLGADPLQSTVAAAAESALTQFEATLGERLSATFRQLEAQRLQRLCLEWLAVEFARPPFSVRACEEKQSVALGQLRINLVIDRIDEQLEDGRIIVLDYKTGGTLDTQNWFGDRRITEPQLPLYAAIAIPLAQPEQPPGSPVSVAAVAFAKVHSRECKFAGVAAESDLLPSVTSVAAAPTAWQDLLGSWKERLEAIADEIQRGEAAVRFEDEQALAYCDVLPLLRLAERKLQFEKQQKTQP